jgi:catechol 2,3-dioxygenase-like lactoylglutathione lyase family enzyme
VCERGEDMAAVMTLIPELAVTDIAAASSMLRNVFGFSGDEALLRLGDQAVALVAADSPAGHGKIDHLALSVTDVDAALAAMLARGARLEATTPDGPREIAEFWGTGVRYVFLQGPEGARIELCARLGGPVRDGLPGHDHLGIPCTDLAVTEAFFLGLGFVSLAANDLVRGDGVTRVRFLGLGASVVELYEPPALRGRVAGFAEPALWRGIRLEGSALAPGLRQGPEGLRVTVV